MTIILFLVGAYLIGAIPTGYLIGRWYKLDLREEGSGNLGSTNVYRVVGFIPSVVVLFVDLLKGFLPIWFFPLWDSHTGPWALAYGLAAILGHVWPVYTRFRGGRGVATAAGTLIALAPGAVAIAFFLWLGTVLLTRTASLGSLLAATTMPIIVNSTKETLGNPQSVVIYALLIAALVWWTHRANIGRLLRREEIKIHWNRKFSPRTNSPDNGDKKRMTVKSVAVLGAGSWGSALAHVLAENGHDVRLWTRNEALVQEIHAKNSNERYLPGAYLNKNIRPSTDMVDTITGTQFVVSACPSHAVREVLGAARPHLDEQTLISTSKGIEITSDLRMSEVIAEVLGTLNGIQTVALSGPSFAEELVQGLPTAVVAASLDEDSAVLVQELFQNGYLRVYTQPDISGVEFGGALKNVIALAAGVSDGILLGNNARAAIITRGLAEIVRLASRLGAKESTLAGLAGLGDLVLTCTSDMSRNRTVGIAIGSGRDPDEIVNNMDQVVEGVRTARAAHELGRKLDVELPITQGIYSILYESVAPSEALARLMAREPKPERWG